MQQSHGLFAIAKLLVLSQSQYCVAGMGRISMISYHRRSQAFIQNTVGGGVMGEEGVWGTEVLQRDPEAVPQ